jgi:DNA-binding response OmpR family regulator
MRDTGTELNGICVLVVEDENDTRDLLGLVLQSYGATAFLASSVKRGLKALSEHRPDVIISDIGMPEYNGYALIAAVRKDEHREIRNMPVIALTAFTTSADRDSALISGFDEYLTKPFDLADLVFAIRQLYERHRLDTAA